MVDQQTVEIERYSFSKLSSWWTCPYGFKLRYIDHIKGEGNAFSSFGTLVHSIMERYSNGELDLWELANVYEWEFDSAVPEPFPKNKFVDLRESYYRQGLTFLQSFEGYDDYKILGVEEQFEIKIDDWIFNGVIDLVFEDENGRLIIRDYKSKAVFKSEAEKQKYARQLYLYSLYIYEKYGKYPDELQFWMFRKNKIEPITFNISALNESIDWAKHTVETIRRAFDYPATCEEFYGTNLCNFRDTCEFKPRPKYTPRRGRRRT